MHRTLGDFVTDLFQNAVEAQASFLTLTLMEQEGRLAVTLTDDGRGMDEAEIERAKDPFHTDGKKHPGRKVGLGLPLVIQTVEATGGAFQIASQKGLGTTVQAEFNLEHWDTPPPGDWSVVLSQLMAWNADFELVLRRRLERFGRVLEYQISRSELREALGSFEDVEALKLLKEYFRSQESMEEQK
ncbi:MAG: ATP-binding protein [Spirochaetales bacterium]|nr:ATP-binding protein [Spirochaetales bacterium]